MSYVTKLIKDLYNLFYTKNPSKEKLTKDMISHFNKYIPKIEKIKQDTIEAINILSQNISKNINLDVTKRLEYVDKLEKLYMEIKVLNINNIANGEFLLEKIVEFEEIKREINLLPQTYIHFELIDFNYIMYIYILFYTGLIYYYDAAIILKLPINNNLVYHLTTYDIFVYSLSVIYSIMTYINKYSLYNSILGKPDEFKKLTKFLTSFGYISGLRGYIEYGYAYFGNTTGRSIFADLFNFSRKKKNRYYPNWKYEESPYDILNITPDTPIEEIKKAYRKTSLKFHPDRNKDPNATEMFLKVSEAYEYLKKLFNYDNGIKDDNFFLDIKSQMRKTFPFLKK